MERPAALILVALLTLWPALFWAGADHILPAWMVSPCLAVLDYAAFTLLHEASHGLVSRGGRWINQLAGEVAATTLMCRFNGFRQVHLRHHLHTNDPERDPDLWSGRGPAWAAPLFWATSDLHYWVAYDRSEPQRPLARRASAWSLTVLLLAVAVLLLTGNGMALLWFWIVPARIALFISTWLFDWLPHQRPFGRPRAENPLQATVNLAVPGWLEPLLLGHAFHLVHHLHPGIPFHRLRKRWEADRTPLLKAGAREVPLFSLPTPSRS